MILEQLRELQDSRLIIDAYEEYIQRDREQDQRERDNWAEAVALEKERTKLAKAEVAIEKDKSDMYLNLYNACRQKRGGIKCLVKRIFTLGLARC